MSPPGTQQVCGTVPDQLAERIRQRAADRQCSVSAETAHLLRVGLDALEKPERRLLDEIEALEATCEQLGRISGRRTTATGCWWAATPAALPPADLLGDADLVALPDGLLLIGGPSTLSIDLGQGQIAAVDGSAGEVSAAIELQQLLPAAALVAPALLGLGAAGPGRRELGCGLTLERLASGAVRIALGGIGPTVPAGVAWQWCAELSGLCARSLNTAVELRQTLDRQLLEVTQ